MTKHNTHLLLSTEDLIAIARWLNRSTYMRQVTCPFPNDEPTRKIRTYCGPICYKIFDIRISEEFEGPRCPCSLFDHHEVEVTARKLLNYNLTNILHTTEAYSMLVLENVRNLKKLMNEMIKED